MPVVLDGEILAYGCDRLEDWPTKTCPECGAKAICFEDLSCISADAGVVWTIWWCACGYRENAEKLSIPPDAVAEYGLTGHTVIVEKFGGQAPEKADAEVRIPFWRAINGYGLEGLRNMVKDLAQII